VVLTESDNRQGRARQWDDGRDPKLFDRRDSDRAAREELIVRHLPLAWGLARRYAGARGEREDLRQVAALGLIHAVDRFDPARGIAFTSFAVPTITGEIRRYIRDTAWSAHVTRDMQEAALKVVRALDSLTASLGRSPTVAEIAAATGRTREQVVEALAAAQALDAESLDAPVAEYDGGDRYDQVGGRDEQLEETESRETARSVVRRLPKGERALLRMRFAEGLTQREIGKRIGVSQMHVSRLLRRALERAAILADA
jgi:RNA polymerase sigma-B factor